MFNHEDFYKHRKNQILSLYDIKDNNVLNKSLDNTLDNNVQNKVSSFESTDVEKLKEVLSKVYDEFKNNKIQKSLDQMEFTLDIYKSFKSNLIPQKVQVKKKNGGTYTAIRWVNKDSGESPDFSGNKKFKKEKEIEGDTIEEKIENVINNPGSNLQRMRDLMSLGIYDVKKFKEIADLDDEGYSKFFLKKFGINHKEFVNLDIDSDGNVTSPEGLTLIPGNEEVQKKYKPDVNISMSIADAREILSSKDFDEFKKNKINELKQKYNITSDTMWLNYDRSIRQLLDTGQPKSIIAFGTGGVGKTYTLEQILMDYEEKHGLRMNDPELDLEPSEYDVISITGSTGKHDLWATLYQNKDNKVIVFDDCDTMWKDQDMINWFKGMLDSSGNGNVRYGNGDKVKLPGTEDEDGEARRAPRQFKFTSKVIFISNMTRDDFIKVGAGPLFESRCKAIDLTMNKEQTLAKLRKITPFISIRDAKGNKIHDVTDEDRNMAITAIEELSDYIEVSKLNGRTLGTLIGNARYNRINNWSKDEFIQQAVSELTT